MDWAKPFKAVWEVCRNSPVMVGLIVLAVIFCLFIMCDAHRNKKRRPRHRGRGRD
jgi:hypothetical protein